MPKIWQAIFRRAAKEHLRESKFARFPTVRAVFIGDFVSTRIMLDGIYEGRELDALAREVFQRLPRESTALDIGANIGNHTVYFTRHFSRVVAFEPNPMVAALLRVNTAEYGNAINVLQIGLSDAPAKLNFKVNEHNLGASRFTDEVSNSVIEVDKLDNLVADLKLDDVSFVKIDVEGHEDRVIAGAFEFLSTAQPIIALEGFYKADPQLGKRVSKLLDSLGYQHFYRLSDRRIGERRSLYSVTPKFLKRHRRLSLEQIDGMFGENHNLVIASVDAIQGASGPKFAA